MTDGVSELLIASLQLGDPVQADPCGDDSFERGTASIQWQPHRTAIGISMWFCRSSYWPNKPWTAAYHRVT
jgi:hypothetical protein